MARGTLGLLALLAGASPASPASPAAAQLRLAQVPIAGRSDLDSLARLGFEVADVRAIGGVLYAVIVVSPESDGALRGGGYAAVPVPDALRPAAATVADTFRVYRSFDKPAAGVRVTLQAWAAADTIIHLDSIGSSVEGRPILAVKIGGSADAPARPNVLFMATHHAREWVSTEMAMRLIRYLADSVPAALRDARDIWVIPVVNPDGYQYTFTGDRLWRKNRRPNAGGTTGVDLNRNYPAFWGLDNLGSSPMPSAETYRGTGPASEPETQAILAFHAAHPPVTAVSYHTFSGLILYPYGYRSGTVAPDVAVYQALAGTDLRPAVLDGVPNSSIAYYHPGPAWHLYPTNGEYTDWAYRTHRTIAFTPELTSGCCASGNYYGFEFPDDSALVERVFRDNLPFALSVIAAAGDLATAQGPSGLVPTPPRIESLWPEAWISLDALVPRPPALTVRTATGALVTRSAMGDSLWSGRIRNAWRSDVRIDTVRAVRADGTGVAAELLSLAGAEDADVGWTGWSRSGDALAGGYAWSANAADTLTSPALQLMVEPPGLWLQFWTKHRGSAFTPTQRGVVQFSRDSGRTWTDVAILLGDGPAWYPVRVDLARPPPPAPQASAVWARVRFVSEGLLWWVDAVGFAADSTRLFELLAASEPAEVSENPVRGDQVVISWPATTQDARVAVYTFTGERLFTATVTGGVNEYVWDLTVGGAGGGGAGARRVVNGAYIVVVELNGRRYRRRLFVARPPGGGTP